MHELSVCQSLLKIVDAEMDKHPGTRLLRVFVDVGRGSTIEPILLKDAFEIITTDGRHDGAELVVREIPLVGRCRSCGRRFTYEEIALGCPDCGAVDIEIESGLELDIKEIEIDE